LYLTDAYFQHCSDNAWDRETISSTTSRQQQRPHGRQSTPHALPHKSSAPATSVAIVHCNPSGESALAARRQFTSHTNSTESFTAADVDRSESARTALDSGISGMDVSASTSTPAAQVVGLKPESSAVVSVIVTSTDESAISSTSVISSSQSDNDDEFDLGLAAPRPSIGVTTNSASPSVSEIFSPPVRQRRTVIVAADDDIYDPKRPKIVISKRWTATTARGSPHPNRASKSWHLLPRRLAAGGRRRRRSAKIDCSVSPPQQPRQQHQQQKQQQHCGSSSIVALTTAEGSNEIESVGDRRLQLVAIDGDVCLDAAESGVARESGETVGDSESQFRSPLSSMSSDVLPPAANVIDGAAYNAYDKVMIIHL
jgi:hypothetical protein